MSAHSRSNKSDLIFVTGRDDLRRTCWSVNAENGFARIGLLSFAGADSIRARVSAGPGGRCGNIL
jgi:hypothetical protein